MADIRTSSMGGVPKGTTADRPSNPSIGDVFYNGTLGCLDIYTAQGWVANSAPPAIPTIGTTTYSGTNKAYNNSSASVAFSPGEGGGLPNSYRATATPGGYTGTGSSSPITVSGLQSGVAYTFSVTGTNNFGTSASSISSNSITATTVPQAPTIGTASLISGSGTSISLSFTAGNDGGAAISNYKYSTDGTNYVALSPAQTTSPLTISGLTTNTPYTFYIKAVNVNGDSVASTISNSVTPAIASISGGTLSSDSTYYYRTFTANGNLVVSNLSATVDVLTIAGGGAGGGDGGSTNGNGGGGAGGVLYSSSQSLSTGTYACTVGAGATGQSSANRISGANSTFIGGSKSFTAIAGGGGGFYYGNVGANGGSGGGAGAGPANGGTGTSGQGNDGAASGSTYGGGGGGAGSAASGVNGGNGIGSYSSWLSAISSQMTGVSGWSTATSGGYIAGGGGGSNQSTGSQGSGGSGGGGAAVYGGSGGVNGAENTGSGGGAQNAGGTKSGNGGSGIIIVRYAKSQVGG